MDPAHLVTAHSLSAAVGWPHRPEDWAFSLDLGHGFVALDGEDVIGTILWWPFGDDHATLGMIIVAGAWQGRGCGRRLMEAAFAEIGPRQVLLNATKEGLPLYAKMGFEDVGVIGQHQGVPNGLAANEPLDGASIRALQPEDLERAMDLDAEATGWRREGLLRRLAAVGGGLVLERDGRLAGYALSRRFGRGHVIGPVVASDDGVARALIGAWIASHGDGFVRIDTPVSSGLAEWLTSHGLLKVDDAVTMSRGASANQRPSPHLFALASQALG